jgi:hypothetical protein
MIPIASPRAWRPWVQGAAASVVALLLVAGGGLSGTTNAALQLSACRIVNLEDAKGLLGAGATVAQDSDNDIPDGQRIAQCTYAVAVGQNAEKTMVVGVVRPMTKTKFAAESQERQTALKARKVAWLGDDAYAYGVKDATGSLGNVTFLKGAYYVGMTVYLKDVDPTQIVARIVPIARKAAGRLP